jgi:hypothetical protein
MPPAFGSTTTSACVALDLAVAPELDDDGVGVLALSWSVAQLGWVTVLVACSPSSGAHCHYRVHVPQPLPELFGERSEEMFRGDEEREAGRASPLAFLVGGDVGAEGEGHHGRPIIPALCISFCSCRHGRRLAMAGSNRKRGSRGGEQIHQA